MYFIIIFQYKVLHRTITCRKKLYEMRLVESPSCLICSEVDFIPHFLFHCSYVNTFWKSLNSWLNNNLNYEQTFDEQDILFGIQGNNDNIIITNLIILIAKHFIYKLRIQDIHNLHFSSFKALLKHAI